MTGLTDAAMIKRLADAAQRAPLEHRRKFAALEAPWHNFAHSVDSEIDKIVTSHRASKKVSGALHEETIYSAPDADGLVSVRKPLSSITKNEVEEIADPAVKALVISKLNGGEPKKVFGAPENLPSFQTRSGGHVPIKRVRLRKSVPTFVLGSGRSARHVPSESNHHVEIYAEIDKNGVEGDWDGEVVSMYEASHRLKSRPPRPVIQTNHGPLAKFKFSLAPGELIECDDRTGKRQMWVVRSVSQLSAGSIQIGIVQVNDARQKSEIVASRQFLRPGPNVLKQWRVRKVATSPLGDLSEARD